MMSFNLNNELGYPKSPTAIIRDLQNQPDLWMAMQDVMSPSDKMYCYFVYIWITSRENFSENAKNFNNAKDREALSQLLAYVRLISPNWYVEFRGSSIDSKYNDQLSALQKQYITLKETDDFLNYYQHEHVTVSRFLETANKYSYKLKNHDEIAYKVLDDILEIYKLPFPLRESVKIAIFHHLRNETKINNIIEKTLLVKPDNREDSLQLIGYLTRKVILEIRPYFIAWTIAQKAWKSFAQNQESIPGMNNRELRQHHPKSKKRFEEMKPGMIKVLMIEALAIIKEGLELKEVNTFITETAITLAKKRQTIDRVLMSAKYPAFFQAASVNESLVSKINSVP